MAPEPREKRAIAFIDGQNLFHAAKEAFGYSFPNYDVGRLTESVCAGQGWQPTQVRFYTGVPSVQDKPLWHRFWQNKLGAMGREGVYVFSRPLRYRNRTVRLPDGSDHTYLSGTEKGIDVRMALDVIRLGHTVDYDVALLFTQDQDLSEVADEIRAMSRSQRRWIKIACAFPVSPTSRNRRGVNGTDWIKLERAAYDSCIDPRDHR
ncbi:MAG: NYN domain-containing protein [Planctomycetes bacterium]|nr:NYN domain-containing protein [Planctomycetota bacterium]